MWLRWPRKGRPGAPFTVAFLALLWTLAFSTGSVVHGPGAHLARHVALGVRPLAHGHWWAPLTSMAFCGDLAGYLATTVLVVVVCVPAERRLGTRRTAAAFVTTHVIGVLVGIALLAPGDPSGRGTALGASTGAVGVALTLTWRCSPLWRRRSQVAVLVALAMLLLYPGGLPDVLRATAGLAGLLLGPLFAGWEQPERPGTGPADAERARALLVRHGGPPLSYMTTWRGNRHWFDPDGRAVVTYRRIGSVALTVGDPVGEPAALPAAVTGFVDFCGRNGWTPCFYSVTGDVARDLARRGWKLLRVAEDARLPLATLTFRGRRWQDVRTATNRARREGVTARWHPYRYGPPEVTAQIRAISTAWVRDKGAPEMGFTLGGLAELADDDVRCLVAQDGRGRVNAVTSWLPVYGCGRVVGWTLDMMRRRPDAPNGTMEFLIASAALHFRGEGAQFVSLSGAPLAGHDRPPGASLPQRVLDRVGRALEPVYGFGSLRAFKAKFQPVYRPLMLAYPGSAALPGIALAVARAYLPGVTMRQAVRLAVRLAPLTVRGAAPRAGAAPEPDPPAPTVRPEPALDRAAVAAGRAGG